MTDGDDPITKPSVNGANVEAEGDHALPVHVFRQSCSSVPSMKISSVLLVGITTAGASVASPPRSSQLSHFCGVSCRRIHCPCRGMPRLTVYQVTPWSSDAS